MRNTRKSIWKDKIFLSMMTVCLIAVVAVAANMISSRNKGRSEEETEYTISLAEEDGKTAGAGMTEGEDGKVLVQNEDADLEEADAKVASGKDKKFQQDKEGKETADTSKETTDSSKEDGTTENADAVSAHMTQQSMLKYDGSTAMTWPVQGELLMEFAMDHTVYHATLEQYKVNPSVLIQAEVGMTVTTPAVGLVQELGWNEEIGNFLRIDLGNAYEVVIGQLENITVQAGQYVAPGNILGTVAQPTKYYSVEGPNVYFQLNKDGAAVDPVEYLE